MPFKKIFYLLNQKQQQKKTENKELLIGFSVDISKNIQVSREIEEQKRY